GVVIHERVAATARVAEDADNVAPVVDTGSADILRGIRRQGDLENGETWCRCWCRRLSDRRYHQQRRADAIIPYRHDCSLERPTRAMRTLNLPEPLCFLSIRGAAYLTRRSSSTRRNVEVALTRFYAARRTR